MLVKVGCASGARPVSRLVVTCFALVMSVSGVARAQTLGGLTASQAQISPVAPESDGINVGSGRLHPSLQLDSHYIVNPGRLPSESSQRANDVFFAVRPGYDLTLPSSRFELSSTGSIEYQKYLDADDYTTLAGQLNLGLLVNKEGMLTVSINDALVRSSEPGLQSATEDPTATTVNPVGPYRLDSWSNQAQVDFDFKPGGGALSLVLGYTNFLISYDPDDGGADQTQLNHMRHTPRLRASWRFLPKTSVFIEAQTILTSFQGDNEDPFILDALIGLNGAVTTKLTALLKLGYGMPFHTASSSSTVVGQLEATWRATDMTSVRAGVVRAYQPVPIYQFVNLTRPYVRLEQAVGAKLTVIAAAQYSYNDYAASTSDDLNAVNRDERVDNDFTASLGVNFHATEFMTVSLVNNFDLRASNQVAPTAQDPTNPSSPLIAGLPFDYTTNDTILRLTLRY